MEEERLLCLWIRIEYVFRTKSLRETMTEQIILSPAV